MPIFITLTKWLDGNREEPESLAQKNAKASVQDLLQFRQAVAFMNDSHPFSRAFGLVSDASDRLLTLFSRVVSNTMRTHRLRQTLAKLL